MCACVCVSVYHSIYFVVFFFFFFCLMYFLLVDLYFSVPMILCFSFLNKCQRFFYCFTCTSLFSLISLQDDAAVSLLEFDAASRQLYVAYGNGAIMSYIFDDHSGTATVQVGGRTEL